MSLNTESYIYKLRLSIDKDAPPDYMKCWLDFKNNCEFGENIHIVEYIKDLCSLKVNKDLPYLERKEGGIGGNDNRIHKQIRFRNGRMLSKVTKYYDNDIVMDQIYNTETDKWTYEELDDLLSAFIKVSETYVKGKDCIRGCIEMTPQDIYRY